MALEEPELHLSPATQRRVIRRLQSLSTQTIVSTHSSLVAACSDPTSVLVIQNNDGQLQARSMLQKPLGKNATNAVRKLFQVNRVELATAMLSEIVLVPEGRLDYDWMTLLTRVVELNDDSDQVCLFGIRVGLVPTSDAQIKKTYKMLSKSHSQVCVLVDGDKSGRKYASKLGDLSSGSCKVLSWPNGWTIEDVVGWIIEADELKIMKKLKDKLPGNPHDCTELVEYLKSNDRPNHGMKGDLAAYEIVASGIASHRKCLERTCTMLNAVAQACADEDTKYFERIKDLRQARMVFKPCP